MSSGTCAGCKHQIDVAARICPYCGADPQTGEKVIDAQAMLQEVFHSREISTTEGVLQFARQRQGIIITAAVFAVLLLLAALHQFAVRRNERDVSAAAAVPLTEVTDLTSQPNETRQLPMPELQYQFDGHPQTMRTFIVEPGAVAPPGAVPRPQPQPKPQQGAPQPR